MENEIEALESLISKTGCMNDTCANLGNFLKDNKCRYDVDNSMCQDYEMAKTLKNAIDILEVLKPLCKVVETPTRLYKYLKVHNVVVYEFKSIEQYNLFKEWLEK